ncbi:DUF2975 domain-containing protein [Gelidibacter salicanalis]|uniref:DUF2975 domain-containing protein n=1 Tax=Gelidibacter salicanalis TaxID=291193 RepID=A0A5C7ARZ1_9FLAO|nr:DUF2975 domain-containing protein [Gelidibacter salicanalis]TXE08622.1 DUF2975 domain-containing protein [Gelidibacter salicanalis]
MKKIKILNGFVLFLILMNLVFFVGNLYISSFTEFGAGINKIDEKLILGSHTRDIQSIFSFILIFGLIYIYLGLKKVVQEGYFIEHNVKVFKIAGTFFIISGIARLSLESYLFYATQDVTHLGFMGQDMFVLLIGYGLFIIADITENGSLMQQDNELTI